MNLTCSQSSGRFERQMPEVSSNAPRRIHSSPSRHTSCGNASLHHAGQFQVLPRRDQSCSPSQYARTPSSFSLHHHPVGSAARGSGDRFPERNGLADAAPGHELASITRTSMFRRPIGTASKPGPCTKIVPSPIDEGLTESGVRLRFPTEVGVRGVRGVLGVRGVPLGGVCAVQTRLLRGVVGSGLSCMSAV